MHIDIQIHRHIKTHLEQTILTLTPWDTLQYILLGSIPLKVMLVSEPTFMTHLWATMYSLEKP